MSKIKFGPMFMGAQGIIDAVEFARRTEEMGFDSLWMPDQIIQGRPSLECFSVLGAFAATTRRLTIGSAVLILPLRSPAVVARSVATVDIISKGRFSCGVGVGGEHPEEFQACNVKVSERGARTDEAIPLIRKLWSESNVTHDGRFYQLENVTIEPRPHQRPYPPIWIGGKSDAAFQRAARLGDGWFPSRATPAQCKEGYDKISAYAKELKRNLSTFEKGVSMFFCTGKTLDEARRVATDVLEHRYHRPVGDIIVELCAMGTPKECIKKIEEFIAAGARHIILNAACPAAETLSHLEVMAKEVLPHFREKSYP